MIEKIIKCWYFSS